MSAESRSQRPRWPLRSLTAAILIAAGVPLTCLYWRSRAADAESCANCRSFIRGALAEYGAAHGGWFPAGGKDEWDSMAKCVVDEGMVHLFTSHALARRAEAHWRANRSLSEEVCCYRYNEGLRDDDPPNLVLVYFGTPTRWECSSHYVGKLGRPCLLTGALTWEWKDEEELQKLQAQTRASLIQRSGKPSHL